MVSSPAADTVQIRWPRPRSSHRGSSSRAALTCAITLTCQDSSHSVSVASAPPGRPTPALAQYRSIAPSASVAAPTSAATPAADAASPGTATAPHAAATRAAALASMSLTTTRAPPTA